MYEYSVPNEADPLQATPQVSCTSHTPPTTGGASLWREASKEGVSQSQQQREQCRSNLDAYSLHLGGHTVEQSRKDQVDAADQLGKI